ncbi:MAG: 1-acyl-sn-glycerol-3-phosphate acyltransferase [Campylobacteraceae bacterium]|jgi:1-acyl-sn-glycerol-3-phosphate acyltransferase|nr:1-acyl-sn-glycerol-3-phosphate acyltransferase [Campylobacteraceae bacterium]
MLQRIRAALTAVIFIFTVSITIILMFFFRKKNRSIRRVWANLQRYIIGFKIKTKGSFDNRAKLIVINHQSILDIIAIEALLGKDEDTAWVCKKEIFNIFFLSQSVKLSNMICIDRNDKKAIVKLLKNVKDRVENGRPIAIFPEGTRGKGEKLLKFQVGAKIIAEKLGLIVQPIVIANARHIFDSQSFRVNGGEATVTFLPTINPKDDDEWYENMRTSMQKELTTLLADIK